MAVKTNTTVTTDYSVTPRIIDFVSRFENNWAGLREMLGISNPVRKEAGSNVYVKTASVTLQSGSVDEGDEIPYSAAGVTEASLGTITIEKYAKGVTLESIDKYGYETAIEKTDDEFLNQLQSVVMNKWYTYMKNDASRLTGSQTSFQMALAIAKGKVENKFRSIHKGIEGVVGWVNYLDFYGYLGGAAITVQTQFGMDYVENFMGYRVIFLCSSDQIPQGNVFATPVNNLIMYYIDPSTSAFARAGLDYTTAGGETNLIGVHVNGKYSHAVSEMFAIMGLLITAEYADGIANTTFSAGSY